MIVTVVKQYGGVSEWFKELVLKTSDLARDQEFESLPSAILPVSIFVSYRISPGEVLKW